MLRWARWAITLGLAGLLLVACGQGGQTDDAPVPTLASFETLPTAYFLTQNAPPPGFSSLMLDPIERGLSDHPGWAYTLSGSFSGTFDASGEAAQGMLSVLVQGNELGQARRVVLEVSGSAFAPGQETVRLEGVRISNDYYLVDVNGQCSQGDSGLAGNAIIADLAAGQIIGGVAQVVPTGHRDTQSNLPVWQYTFAPQDARLPAVVTHTNSEVTLAADLWVAPEVNAVLRYEVTVTVRGVHLLWADRTGSTVSGTLSLRYELDPTALEELPNISVPHGC